MTEEGTAHRHRWTNPVVDRGVKSWRFDAGGITVLREDCACGLVRATGPRYTLIWPDAAAYRLGGMDAYRCPQFRINTKNDQRRYQQSLQQSEEQ